MDSYFWFFMTIYFGWGPLQCYAKISVLHKSVLNFLAVSDFLSSTTGHSPLSRCSARHDAGLTGPDTCPSDTASVRNSMWQKQSIGLIQESFDHWLQHPFLRSRVRNICYKHEPFKFHVALQLTLFEWVWHKTSLKSFCGHTVCRLRKPA